MAKKLDIKTPLTSDWMPATKIVSGAHNEIKKVGTKMSLKHQLARMRYLAKNNYGGHAKTFWVGYDKACFELQKKYGFVNLEP